MQNDYQGVHEAESNTSHVLVVRCDAEGRRELWTPRDLCGMKLEDSCHAIQGLWTIMASGSTGRLRK